MNIVAQYFSEYKTNHASFNSFHNEVINMPRDNFKDSGLEKIRVISGYILLTELSLFDKEVNYKELQCAISKELSYGNFPKYRDRNYEQKYFAFTDINLLQDLDGRMFRHLMALSVFFELLTKTNNKKVKINYEKCKEYYLSKDDLLMPIARNNLIMLNIDKNDFIKSLRSIEVYPEADYRPAFSILKYMEILSRPVTRFEISILLGRVDSVQEGKAILERAVNIGRTLPPTQNEQIEYFFDAMNWKNEDGSYFTYRSSQEPDFKFNNFIIFLEKFDLVKYDKETKLLSITEYSKNILNDEISYVVADLEKLLAYVDAYEEPNSKLADLLLYQRNPELLKLAKEDEMFIQKMNFRSINNPIILNGKRKRNRLIAELAKIQVNYTCQYARRKIFKMSNGRYYCEAHHIIEFSTENGADITENLLVIGPEAHKILHHACGEEKRDAYLQLIKNGALSMERFKKMVSIYDCLTVAQIDILFQKGILTNSERLDLINLKNMK